MQTITINKLILAHLFEDRVLITVVTDLDLMIGYYHIPHFQAFLQCITAHRFMRCVTTKPTENLVIMTFLFIHVFILVEPYRLLYIPESYLII